uniref:Putative General substrate transporter:Major facilitator superfamily MFS_1 n=1 Tax=mine drainage metagenome TaxID=410659 RepID=E6QDX6_9ZZZZ
MLDQDSVKSDLLHTITEGNSLTPSRRIVAVLLGAAASLYVLVEVVSGLAAVTAQGFWGSGFGSVGPALVFGLAGAVSVPAGKLSDRIGRRPVITLGFIIAAMGAAGVWLSVVLHWAVVFLLALAFIGVGVGILRLVKAAAADIYPSHSRTKGIGIVQMGALGGAWFGLAIVVVSRIHAHAPAFTWMATAGILAIGAAIMQWLLRPDPLALARVVEEPTLLVTTESKGTLGRPLYKILSETPAISAVLVTICMVYGVMVMDMSLAGIILVDMGSNAQTIMIVMAIHFTGMFGPMRWAGRWAARYNRRYLGIAGLTLVMVASAAMGFAQIGAVVLAGYLFLIGLGWCVAWIAGLGELVDYARYNERGALMGLADMGSDLLAALIVVGGGAVLAVYQAKGFAFMGAFAMLGALMVTLKWWPRTSRHTTYNG